MAVRKLHVGFGEGFELAFFGVVNFGRDESVGEFLAVSADILNRGSSSETWNFAESFDAGKIMTAGKRDYVVPVFAAHDFEFGAVFEVGFCNAEYAVFDDDAVEAFVVTDSVCAIT